MKILRENLANIKLELDQNDLGRSFFKGYRDKKVLFISIGKILKPIPFIWLLKSLVKMDKMNFVRI